MVAYRYVPSSRHASGHAKTYTRSFAVCASFGLEEKSPGTSCSLTGLDQFLVNGPGHSVAGQHSKLFDH